MGARANVLVGVAEVTLNVGVNGRVVGYTSDGVNMSVRSDYYDAKVDENIGTIIRRLTDQEITVSLNLAEGSLQNLLAAIPSASLTGSVLTIGAGTLQEHRLTLRGLNPAGYERVIVLDRVNPTGEVAIPYKKGEASIIPVTFSALVEDNMQFGRVTDAAAAPPTLVVGASTKSTTDGTKIEALFSKTMEATPTGKHLEFWFTQADFSPPLNLRAFSAVARKAGVDTTFELTVSGAAITSGKALKLFYCLGTILSGDGGILRSFADQTVVARP